MAVHMYGHPCHLDPIIDLAKKYNYRLYKVTKRTESKVRSFGYNIDYQNLCLEDLLKLPNLLIFMNV